MPDNKQVESVRPPLEEPPIPNTGYSTWGFATTEPSEPVLCKNCRKRIAPDADAACGWRHMHSKAVICDPTEATPTIGAEPVIRALAAVRMMAEEFGGDFRAGILLAVDEIGERTGIKVEYDPK